MYVEDVFDTHQGRRVLVTGRIERGRVREGDEVEIVCFHGGTVLPVEGIDVYRRRVAEARADMNVGLSLPGKASGSVARGQVLAAPGRGPCSAQRRTDR